jgi:hypothetical protein
MTAEPISWLLLERYALGELGPEERADVEARLAASEVDRACLAEIRADNSELPALPSSVTAPARLRAVPAASAKAAPGPVARPSRARHVRWIAATGTLCAAAASLLVVVRTRPTGDELATPTPQTQAPALPDDGIKGAEVSLRLISDRQGTDPKMFTSGERFKLELSCPPRLGAALRLFVFQGEQVFEPLPLTAPLACGNLVPWPGAFALDGSDAADVCVSWGAPPDPVTRLADLGTEVSCVRVTTP